MKRILLILITLQFFSPAKAQTTLNPDSLKLLLSAATDTTKVLLLAQLGESYAFVQIDTALSYAEQAIILSRQLNFKKGEARALASYSWALWQLGNLDNAIAMALKSLNLSKSLQDYKMIAQAYNLLTVFYRDAGEYKQALNYFFLSKNLHDSLNIPYFSEHFNYPAFITTASSIYLKTNQVDSASFYLKKATDFIKKNKENPGGYFQLVLGSLEVKKKHYEEALDDFRAGIQLSIGDKNYLTLEEDYEAIAAVYQETGKIDSSIYYAKETLSGAKNIYQGGVDRSVGPVTTILARDYELKQESDSAIKYLELSIATKDSLVRKQTTRAIQNVAFNEQLQEQEIEAARITYRNQVRIYGLVASVVIFLLIAVILWRNNRRKQKLNTLLGKQKEQIENNLKELKSTHAQLVQKEKMASLGELTAGIAHEIQNPLNFVNNFSEVNRELINELVEEMDMGNTEEVKAIAFDIKDNEDKINHHGKRADAIVKGMLQHSRSSTGKKEPTDINALCDEYLRLSFHGMRAKDKSFNADMETDFDESMGKINVVPQDIGRVLLNLFNNAFYACNERSRSAVNAGLNESFGQEQKNRNLSEYKPTVSVSTKKVDHHVEIKVKDNGNGIPQSIIDKIFQPFFTTKPTGEGTGLGLSLSYDIIKAHGGEIKAESKEGEGSEFIIHLPGVFRE